MPAIFFDSTGSFTAYVVDDEDVSAAKGAIRARLSSGKLKLSPKDARAAALNVKIIKGAFTYQQLSDWRDLVFENLLGKVRGVTSDDLDEGHNRVTIGILPGQEGIEADVLAQLAKLGVPSAAIRFVSEGPVEQRSASVSRSSHMMNPTRLDANSDILAGGLWLAWVKYDGAERQCSIRYTARLADGTHALITASHCSEVKFGADTTKYYQSRPAYSPTSIGSEYYDPQGGTCPALWNCTQYRFADANLVRVTSTRWQQPGLLARPVNRGYLASSSLDIDPNHPFIYITSAGGYDVLQGQSVDKIGAVSGWTTGGVTGTCTDYIPGGYDFDWDAKMTRCAYQANLWNQGGDSGSPVFTWDGRDGAVAVGIFFGSSSASHAYFSKWSYIYGELNGTGLQPVITTGVTVSLTPYPTVSLSGNSPTISWPAASTTNTTSPTTYYVHRSVWDASTYTWLEQDNVVGTTTSTSFTDGSLPVSIYSYVGDLQPAQCTYTSVSYTIEAYNQGANSLSMQMWFQGPANGANPNQETCP